MTPKIKTPDNPEGTPVDTVLTGVIREVELGEEMGRPFLRLDLTQAGEIDEWRNVGELVNLHAASKVVEVIVRPEDDRGEDDDRTPNEAAPPKQETSEYSEKSGTWDLDMVRISDEGLRFYKDEFPEAHDVGEFYLEHGAEKPVVLNEESIYFLAPLEPLLEGLQ